MLGQPDGRNCMLAIANPPVKWSAHSVCGFWAVSRPAEAFNDSIARRPKRESPLPIDDIVTPKDPYGER